MKNITHDLKDRVEISFYGRVVEIGAQITEEFTSTIVIC